ncbi:hypothetical protein PHYBLDRAFT_143598 [Phycomyces blakesleeanus NRRL 1555(-)]|uniref:Uncharacterized protein n=1 Tax=Phycomyces blakesleeanus (strain ATCC 8743b / DSM 1359 / FGSC 10004 / NBRC 33097 / NRRL 1555) TaxID=763407 RepID=A0A163ARS8_PHYB8|nr:hypothetical protein PHYBLDRAFT_143598 [Phycomyces blakesleeanus NRRL 1555(-)]OAD75341.1 hypothetical protein PHYBLDRAFT_143598 [Phycomyces blakesleeanus NRRL 1555(-)]|eukprot:XP_018293381.1 hypothetical protein PHYBLDRAFT_143598 [Phycomyces blakesleeanus NRRL 1555(-)]
MSAHQNHNDLDEYLDVEGYEYFFDDEDSDIEMFEYLFGDDEEEEARSTAIIAAISQIVNEPGTYRSVVNNGCETTII